MRIWQLTNHRRVAIAAAALGLLAPPVEATTLAPASFAEMAFQSHVIVHGRIETVRSQSTGDRRTIESLVTVAVIESLKGEPPASIVFKVPNGRVGRYRRIMVGAPEFREGDEVVLFLKGAAPAIPAPFGLSQGVYRVAGQRGQRVVTPLVPDPGRLVRGDPARTPLSLEAFGRAVRDALEPRP
jgi:hypothetical protein